MYKSQFLLLGERRFLPLFITQFLGAFNDNLLKNAIVVLITFVLIERFKEYSAILIPLASCLLILPMFLFSAQAGALADKYEKATLIRRIKLAEIIFMSLAAIGFLQHNVTLLMIVLFLKGTQSAFFGPIKYSILPSFLAKDELVGGTALIEIATFLAILLGNILGVIFLVNYGVQATSTILVSVALFGYLSSLFIPPAFPPVPDLKISLNFVKETYEIIRFSKKYRDIFLCILGISWFWAVGFLFLTIFPNYVRDFLGSDQDIFVLFLTVFSIGVGIGSGLCNRLLKGQIEATYVPIAALGISLFSLDLYFATPHLTFAGNTLDTLSQFLQKPTNWRITFDIFMVAVFGGVYIVPLYAMLQHRAQASHKARIIASNNILNALFMSLAALITIGLFEYTSSTIRTLFLYLAILNLVAMLQSIRLLPGALIKSLLRLILHALYRVDVKGLENFESAGERVVIAPNHTSFLDGLLLAAYLPGRLSFAINNDYINKWWVKPVRLFVDTFGVDPTKPHVLRQMVKYVKENRKLVIFPEGRITLTGTLMKIYEGPGLIADKAEAVILPILISGAQYTPFSKLRGKVRLKWFPQVQISVFPPQKLEASSTLSPRKRRLVIGEKLYQIMSNTLFLGQDTEITLFKSLLDAREVHGPNHIICEDIKRKPLNYNQLIRGSILVGSRLAKLSQKGDAVGLLLPNLCVSVLAFFGLQAYQRVTALLNFSTGAMNVLLACETAKIKLVVSARAFIENAKLENMVKTIEAKGIHVVYLEDLLKHVSYWDKFITLLKDCFPRFSGLLPKENQANKPAVILFTSGSEGTPKAVVLSSTNIQANKSQLSSRVDFGPTDIVLNALPIFHSFGLTAGTLLPILYGMKVFFYPSPLHYRIIPEISYDIHATILFGTNTFLAAYARYANAYDFYSIRYVFAGAEKLKEENRRLWSDKFGVRIFEGYGATETSPVISTNTPMHNKPGSVGKLMPGITYNLENVPGVEKGKRLVIRGPNIMLGYMFHDNPGVIVPPLNGWYDTGDIVSIDDEGYIHILGRSKRFAKIGGEMISLTFVENYISQLWPNSLHAIVTIPDERKGEQLVLVTTQEDADRKEIVQFAQAHGISEITIPKVVKVIAKMPLLGSGKIDYAKIQTMAVNIR